MIIYKNDRLILSGLNYLLHIKVCLSETTSKKNISTKDKMEPQRIYQKQLFATER